MSKQTADTITANIALIEARLARASSLAREAHQAALGGEHNRAIGTLLPMTQDLADADALLKTVLILHRSRSDRNGGGTLWAILRRTALSA